MLKFKIKKFIDQKGDSDLVDWYHKLDMKGKTDFKVRMEYLCSCQIANWPCAYCKHIKDGIYEIRFKNKKVQQRPLGYFGPNNKEFTFLFPATEKGDSFVPKDAVDRAIDRKNITNNDSRRADEWDIDPDK